MENLLTELFISQEMWIVFWSGLILIIVLILDNIRLRRIRKINNRLIDLKCKDVYNGLQNRSYIILKRMEKDKKLFGPSCSECKYEKKIITEIPCKNCVDKINFEAKNGFKK